MKIPKTKKELEEILKWAEGECTEWAKFVKDVKGKIKNYNNSEN